MSEAEIDKLIEKNFSIKKQNERLLVQKMELVDKIYYIMDYLRDFVDLLEKNGTVAYKSKNLNRVVLVKEIKELA